MGLLKAIRRMTTKVDDPRDSEYALLRSLSECYQFLESFNVDPDRPLRFYRPKEYGAAGAKALCRRFYFDYDRDWFFGSKYAKKTTLHIIPDGNRELYLRDLIARTDRACRTHGDRLFMIAFDSPIEGEMLYSESFYWEFDEKENAIILFGEFLTKDEIALSRIPKARDFLEF